MKRWGWNVNGQRVGDTAYFLSHIQKLKPAWMLIMSNIQLAQQVYDISNGQTNVIDRAYSTHEGNQWKTQKPIDYASELMDGRKHIWKYVLNEPNATSDTVEYRNNWLADVTEILTNNGYKAVVGNLAAGAYEQDWIRQGKFDRLLAVLSERRSVAKLGIHEYGAFLLPFTHYRWDIHGLRDRANVQPDLWLYLDHEDGALRMPDYRNEFLPYYYHLFRSHWLQQHVIHILGKSPVGMIHTEFGWDRMPDLVEGVESHNNIYDILKDNHGVPYPYENIRGAYSHHLLWAYYFPHWTVSQAIFEQFIWCEANYNDWYEAFLPFMWSFGDNWDTVDAFNFGADRELHGLLENWNIGQDDTPDPDPDPDPDPPIVIEDDMIDTLDYLRGDGRVYKLSYDWRGGGFKHVQTQSDGRRFFHTKGNFGQPAQWEELWYDHDYVYRGTDVSPNDYELYQIHENGQYGQRWLPRKMRIGDGLFVDPLVIFRNKSDGSLVPGKEPYTFAHWIELKAVHDTYRFPQSGIVLNDVMELWGYLEDFDGFYDLEENFERYFYAKGFGLVAWQDPLKGWNSYISSTHESGVLNRLTLDWLTLPDLPPLQPKEDEIMEFPIDDPRWTKTWIAPKNSGLNVRPTPQTGKNIVTVIEYQSAGLILKDEAVIQPDGTWYPIRLNSDIDKVFDDGDFAVSGWVRKDVAVFEDYIEPSEPVKYNYIYMPEAGASQPVADIVSRIIRAGVAVSRMLPLDASNKWTKAINILEGLATLFENWSTTIDQFSGIVILPEDTSDTGD